MILINYSPEFDSDGGLLHVIFIFVHSNFFTFFSVFYIYHKCQNKYITALFYTNLYIRTTINK